MNVGETVRDVVSIAWDDNVAFMGASVAYYALASVVPLLAISLAVLSFFDATGILISALESSLSASGQEVLERALSGVRGRAIAGGVGLLFALWSGLKVFRGLSIAFNEVYDITSKRSFVDHIWRSLLVLGMLLGGVALLSATSVVLGYGALNVPYPRLVGNVVAFLALVLVFFPLYYVMPPVTVSVRHAVPGAVLAALGWVVLQVAFLYYAGAAGAYSAYGFLGGLLLFVTFVYIASIVVLVGAIVNVAVDAGPTRTRSPTRAMGTPDQKHPE
jgi:membrane protein